MGMGAFKGVTAEFDEAKPVAKSFFETAGKNWNVASVESYFGDTYRKSSTKAETADLFKTIGTTMGPLKTLEPLNMAGFKSNSINGKTTTLISLKADAKFAKGDGKVVVTMTKEAGKWKVAGFNVDSPQLKDWKGGWNE